MPQPQITNGNRASAAPEKKIGIGGSDIRAAAAENIICRAGAVKFLVQLKS
jgi:hypothetical protein